MIYFLFLIFETSLEITSKISQPIFEFSIFTIHKLTTFPVLLAKAVPHTIHDSNFTGEMGDLAISDMTGASVETVR